MITDQSGNGNDGVQIGAIEYIPFNKCTYGALCDDINYIQIPGTAASNMSGFYKDRHPGGTWWYFHSHLQVPTITRSGDDYVLKDGAYAHLVVSDAAPAGQQGPNGFGNGFDEGFQ